MPWCFYVSTWRDQYPRIMRFAVPLLEDVKDSVVPCNNGLRLPILAPTEQFHLVKKRKQGAIEIAAKRAPKKN